MPVEVISASFFDGDVREAVISLKYRNARPAAAGLARLIGPVPAGEIDLLTWLPTAAARRRHRGIDHSEVIARHVAAASGVPLVRVLRRLDGARQTGAPRDVRLRGPAFTAHRRVAGLHIGCVDDVVTTGATVRAAAAALLGRGAASVRVWTVATVPG